MRQIARTEPTLDEHEGSFPLSLHRKPRVAAAMPRTHSFQFERISRLWDISPLPDGDAIARAMSFLLIVSSHSIIEG